jgi:molybdopterin converting factor small subunit
MVCINYNCYSLRRITKTGFENIIVKENAILGEVFNILINKYGESLKIRLFDSDTERLKLIVLVNGSSVDDLSLRIEDNDKINIVSPITGG